MKKVILFVASGIIMLIFTNFGFFGNWFQHKVLITVDSYIDSQSQDLDIEHRMSERWGGPYLISKNLADFFIQKNIVNPLVLMPPSAYLKANGSNINMPEPIVFYYFTGYKSICYNSPNADKATYALIINRKHFSLVPLKSKRDFQIAIKMYKKIKP